MSSARANPLRLVFGALLLWAFASLIGVGRRDSGSKPARLLAPRPDRLGRKGLAALGVLLALILIAAIGVPLLLEGRAAVAREQWAVAITGGNPVDAPMLMIRNGCAGCHSIAGVPAAHGRTGPALDGIAERSFIAGVLPNTPRNLVAWIRDARGINPRTAMPSTFVSEADARDMAAYLYALR